MIDILNWISGLVVFALIIQKARSVINKTKRREEINNEKYGNGSGEGSDPEP